MFVKKLFSYCIDKVLINSNSYIVLENKININKQDLMSTLLDSQH